MLDGTQDLEVARSWAAQLLKDKNPAKYYISAENFVAAFKNESTFSFVVTGEPFYGHLYGSGAYLDPRCNDIAIAAEEDFVPAGFAKRGGGFQFWEIQTEHTGAAIELLRDAHEINELIDRDAPDSSVRPGDPEEIFWWVKKFPRSVGGRCRCSEVAIGISCSGLSSNSRRRSRSGLCYSIGSRYLFSRELARN